MHTRNHLAVVTALLALVPACAGEGTPSDRDTPDPVTVSAQSQESRATRHGRDVWFNKTFGGEKFFTFLAAHPDPAKRIRIGFAEVMNTPRAERFARWGTINNPDCSANPAGGADICPDPTDTGVIGIKKFPGPSGTTMFGVTCASCHAGFDPVWPPADPAEPRWHNIHPTIGNQHLMSGKIFSVNLAPTDVRRFMFDAWPAGTVDTTALFNDGIMNPGVITAFWEHPSRPRFDVGMSEPKMRNGQGGEDDVGGDLAAVRVYTNIGVCFAECVAPRAATDPRGPRPDPNAPIDLAQCKRDCADFPPQADLDDMGDFLASVPAPRYPSIPWQVGSYLRGRGVFEQSCAGCHDNDGRRRNVLTNDEVNPIVDNPAQSTNTCRARTTNWDAGKLWAAFSSDLYKARGAAGDKGYRTMPLAGIWATAPFLHNQAIGGWTAPEASPWDRGDGYRAAMLELLSATRTPKVFVMPVAFGPIPAGTPLHYIFSKNQATGELLCDDLVENRGHTYGSGLSARDKDALIYWLQFQ